MYDAFHTALASFAHAAHAASLSIRLPVINSTGPGESPASFVNYLVVFAIAFVGFAAIIGVVWGGITHLTAAGNASKASDGTDRIKSSVLGLVLVLAAIAVLYTLNPSLVTLRNPNIPIVRVPVVQNIPPLLPGSCTILRAFWSTNQACFNGATKKYDTVIMVAEGQNCDSWGASFNVVDAGTGATIETLGDIFQGNQLQASWQPKESGTYTFNIIAGSAATRTQAFSGQMAVTDGACVSTTGGLCPAAVSGPCSVGELVTSRYGACFGGNSIQASAICLAESANIITAQSRSDVCRIDGLSFSWGLFQINLTANTLKDPVSGTIINCPAAFRRGTPLYESATNTYNCEVIDPQLYAYCVGLAKNADVNIQKACELSRNGTNWTPWLNTKNKCGF